MELHEILKARFSWLGTDEDANGADVVQALCELYDEARETSTAVGVPAQGDHRQ